jgi:hypothetical protein
MPLVYSEIEQVYRSCCINSFDHSRGREKGNHCSLAMDHLDAVYTINERIRELQEQIEKLKEKSSRKGKATDNSVVHRIEDLTTQINQLILERTRTLKKVRWEEKRTPKVPPAPAPVIKRDPSPVPVVIARVPTPPPRIPTPPPRVPTPVPVVVVRVPTPPPRIPTPPPRVPTPIPIATQSILLPSTLRVSGMHIGTNATTLNMIPTWFKPDDREAALNGIVYPTNTTERDQFITMARFRTALGKSKDFTVHPLDVSEKSTETLVLSLEAFARQFGGQLSFTNRDLSFENSAESAACGVPNLGSAHLLANDSVPTANFSFNVNLDYDKELACSSDAMENFIINFSVAIAQVLGCKTDYVRVFSIEKSAGKPGTVKVNFGLTTTNQQDTESLAAKLLVRYKESVYFGVKI